MSYPRLHARRARRSRLGLLVAAVLIGPVLTLVAGAQDDPAAPLYREAYRQVLDEKWPAAAQAMESLLATYPKSAWADDAQFWHCYAREKAGDEGPASLEASFRCYLALVRERPSSDWADDGKRALARLAGNLAEKGRPQFRDQLDGLDASPDEDLFPVLMALADIGDERAVATIVERLRQSDDERTRERIVHILGRIDDPAARKALQAVLDGDPSLDVRVAALRSISEQDGPDAVRLLAAVAADAGKPAELRQAALRGLGEQDDPAVVELLGGVARGADPELAETAIRALAETGDPAAVGILGEIAATGDPELRSTAVRALGQTGDAAAVAVLLKLAKAGDPSVRRDAARSLGEIGTPEARDALIQLLGDGR